MKELSERQKLILTLVVHEYAQTAAPVGSQYLVDRYQMDMSSATIRNEMAALTEMGYVRQPYTSAGRVPTEDGYRYFVGHLVKSTDLPVTTRRMISHQFYQSRHDVDQWMKLAASVLANQSRQASLVTAPHPQRAQLKHVELIATRGRQILMVMVMAGGEVRQRFLTLKEPLNQEQLSIAAEHITRLFHGRTLDDLPALRSQLTDLEADLARWVVEEMSQAEALVSGEIYMDGLTNVMVQPEFASSDEARRGLRLLEERSLLQDLLSRTVLNDPSGGVQVLIGGEGTWEDLRQWSIILAQYGLPGMATGTLGVFGPIRMPYGHAISVVRYLSGLLSEMVVENLGDETSSMTNEVSD